MKISLHGTYDHKHAFVAQQGICVRGGEVWDSHGLGDFSEHIYRDVSRKGTRLGTWNAHLETKRDTRKLKWQYQVLRFPEDKAFYGKIQQSDSGGK